jgi:hypothetical protein
LPAFASLASSVTVSSSTNTSIVGQSVTFTATVSPSTATGTVKFNDTSTSPPTILGTGVIAGGFATFTTSSLLVGNHNIVVKYSGDTNNAPSTSTMLVQNVNQVSATLTSLSSNATGNLGQTISDFVHMRNQLLKEERQKIIHLIHECHTKIKNASPADRKQIRIECKTKIHHSREKYKELKNNLKEQFMDLKFSLKLQSDENRNETHIQKEITHFKNKTKHFEKKIHEHGNKSGHDKKYHPSD